MRDVTLIGTVIGIGSVISLVDAKSFRIPDLLVILLGCVTLLFTIPEGWEALCLRTLAALGGGLVLFFLYVRGGLGLGDVKYGAVLSYAVGLYGTWIMLAIASLTGVLWYLVRGLSPSHRIPFAPFLTVGAASGLLWKITGGGG